MSTAALNPVTVKIEPAIKQRVQRLAEARNRTAHWVMHEAIVQFVEREEKREGIRQDVACDHERGRYLAGQTGRRPGC
jgi:predicted transcriptional regulator